MKQKIIIIICLLCILLTGCGKKQGMDAKSGATVSEMKYNRK